MLETVSWTPEGVALIDQRLLPRQEVILTCRTPEEVMEAIRSMVVRGAPAIGVTAAMGIALGAKQLAGSEGSLPVPLKTRASRPA